MNITIIIIELIMMCRVFGVLVFGMLMINPVLFIIAWGFFAFFWLTFVPNNDNHITIKIPVDLIDL